MTQRGERVLFASRNAVSLRGDVSYELEQKSFGWNHPVHHAQHIQEVVRRQLSASASSDHFLSLSNRSS